MSKPRYQFLQERADHWYTMAQEATEPAQIASCEAKGDGWERQLQAHLETLSRTYVSTDVLETIQASDPDGKPQPPTEQDYRAHRDWAVGRFGEAAWYRYSRGGWVA